MLSEEILEAQETVELPAREMMDWNLSCINAFQVNYAAQASANGSTNLSQQSNLIVVMQSN